MDLFADSPEGIALLDQGKDLTWASHMLEYGMTYLSLLPPDMEPDNLKELLFDIFPRKIAVEPDYAPEIIQVLHGFWAFLQREFRLANAAALLRVLDTKAERAVARELGHPANFGMAKSFFMMGKQRGLDLSTPEGLNEWAATYN